VEQDVGFYKNKAYGNGREQWRGGGRKNASPMEWQWDWEQRCIIRSMRKGDLPGGRKNSVGRVKLVPNSLRKCRSQVWRKGKNGK